MAERKNISDPTRPTRNIEIAGNTYTMSIDLGHLAEAEDRFVAAGDTEVNLLSVLPRLRLSTTRIIFACMIGHHHPQIPYKTAVRLLDGHTDKLYEAAEFARKIWEESVPPEKESNGEPGDPPPAGETGDSAGPN